MDFSILKKFLDSWSEEFTPGYQIVIYKDNQKVFAHHNGYADLENNIRHTDNNLFNVYSCSKVATVTAGMQLFEKGKFLLDDPLYEYIPEYREMFIKDVDGNIKKAQNPIKMRDLFMMTAGFDYDFHTQGFKKANEITNGKNDTLMVAKCIASDPLSFEPGEKWNYSICHDVLGAAIQAITGMRFSEYVKQNIFEPLGMNESYYHIPENEKHRLAQQYYFVTEGMTISENTIECESIRKTTGGKIYRIDNNVSHIIGEEYDSGGAGITTTCEDYAKFVIALTNKGVGLNGERILSEASVDLMRTNHLNEEQMKTYTWPDLKGYGYGLGVRTLVDKVKAGSLSGIGEFGWSGAGGSLMICDPGNKLSVFFNQHIINPKWAYFGPRLFNVIYSCLNR